MRAGFVGLAPSIDITFFKLAKRRRPEHDIQSAAFDWFRNRGIYLFPELALIRSITSGQPRFGGQLMYYKREGLETGYPDIHLAVPRWYPSLWIEVKSKTGVVRDEQRQRIYQLRNNGHCVVVRRSVEGIISTVIDYLLYNEIEDASSPV